MSANKKSLKYGVNQDTVYTTVKGTSVFPKLVEPDTKYKKDGEFSSKMKFSKEGEDALIALLTPIYETALEGARKEEKNKTLKGILPWKPEIEKIRDEAGDVIEENETGVMLFNFKLNALIKTKAGKEFPMRPRLFDAGNPPRPINPEGLSIGGGSILKIAFTTRPYFMAKEKEVGLTLQIQGVQIVNLVEFGQKSADSLGFGAEEGGFAGSQSEAPEMPSSGSDAPDPTDSDF